MKNVKHIDYWMSNISYRGPLRWPLNLLFGYPRKLAWVIHELWCSVKPCYYSSLPQRAPLSTERVLMFCKSRLLLLINPESSITSCTCDACQSTSPSPACFILAPFLPHPQLCLLPPLTSLTLTNTHWGHTLHMDQDRTAQTLSTKYIFATVSKLSPIFPVRWPLPSGGDAFSIHTWPRLGILGFVVN